MHINTLSTGWHKPMTTASTATEFSDLIPTTTQPTASATRCIIECGGTSGGETCNAFAFAIIGVATNDQTAAGVRFSSWDVCRETPNKDLWIAHTLGMVDATFSDNYPGVAGSAVAETFLFADTMTILQGNTSISIEVISPGSVTADSGVAVGRVDICGAQLVEVTFDRGTCSSVNILIKKV